jgi:hypothetical protein
MQMHYDLSSFKRIGDLPVRREPSGGDGRVWTISQDPLDAMMRRLAAKAEEANGGDFMRAKGRVFGMQVNDQLTHVRRKASRLVL